MLGLVEKLIDPVSSVLDKVVVDKNEKARLAHEIATMSEKFAAENAALQAQANIEQSKHPSLFVAGARPAIMWICPLASLSSFSLCPSRNGCARSGIRTSRYLKCKQRLCLP